MPTVKNQKPNGFTLVEILVVMGIMMVLAVLSLGVFFRVQERGRSATCRSNLKQIALAVQQYTQDYSGQYPPYNYAISTSPYSLCWYDLLQPYLKTKSVFWCPSNQLREQQLPTYEYNLFGLNSVINTPKKPSTFIGSHESVISSASDVVLNQDSWALYGDGSMVGGTLVQSSCGELMEGTLHSGGANFSYVDGHVKWISSVQQGEVSCDKRHLQK